MIIIGSAAAAVNEFTAATANVLKHVVVSNIMSYVLSACCDSQRYFSFLFVFSLAERKNEQQMKLRSTMLPNFLSLSKGRQNSV